RRPLSSRPSGQLRRLAKFRTVRPRNSPAHARQPRWPQDVPRAENAYQGSASQIDRLPGWLPASRCHPPCSRWRFESQFSTSSAQSVAFIARSQTTELFVVLGLEHFTAAIDAVGADVVTQVDFARSGLNCRRRGHDKIV